ncbi:glycine betaine/proline transport system substrate-binding protein [Tranquillimonas rosea]|uniref:Glycine betaine/proline transport system substrate-binding protein n=1 Tax=Tranquillimonas rosea TaxID=641238 RepID=A0A1H9UUY8_9RHOB|nr:glycine betaine/L-proline ABC transporter substrate-binding protein ProX [Tranquillimonas rosea]SES13149.1 glycine betaine/proline transport system substrate-binding protein [Tranquillimonas rosea]
MTAPNLFTKLSGATALAALMTVPAFAQDSQPGEGTTIQMAQPTWDTGYFYTQIYKQALEELGYSVEGPVALDNPIFYQAVAQGDQDLWVDGWFPLHNTYESTFQNGAEKVGTVAEGGALEGYLVSADAQEEFDIQSLEDFKRDEVKEAFDRNGDGKADMVACPPGWGCEVNISHHMEAYGLEDHINLVKAGYSASMADAVAAEEQGNPIFFYTWTPNWTVNVLKPGEDVMWIEVPEVDLPEDMADLEDAATMDGVEGCVADPCTLGFPANDIVPVANTEFLEANPAARALLEEASVPLEDVFEQNAKMYDGENEPSDIEQHAATWIENNRDTVDGWLEAARSAAEQ